MPLANGQSQTVIAVTTKEANYWIIAYTILLTSIFAAIAKLISGLILTYAPLRGRGNRHVALVTYFNAGSPLTAATQMVQYAYLAAGGSLRAGKWAVNWDTFRFSMILCSIAVANIVTSQVSKFVVGGNKLVVRHAARANPSAMFYPTNVPASAADLSFQLVQPLRAAAAYQALGRLESSQANLDKALKITLTDGSSADGPTFQLEYSYTITGADFGLQLANGLNFHVFGHCETRWDWVERFSNNSDGYPLWGLGDWETNPTYDTAWVDKEKDNPPWVNISPSNDTLEIIKAKRSFAFALVPNVSHRKSPVPNTVDPWYMTEDNPPDNLTSSKDVPTPYRVRRARPPISCYQNDTWSLGNARVHHVDDLHTLPGLELSDFMRNTLFPIELAAPAIIQVGNNLGYAQLSSSQEQTVNQKFIYASRCNASRDIQRLVQVSFLASREVVRNTVLLYSTLQGQTVLNNSAAVNGAVPDAYADFILESKDVAALSVPTLLTVPIICALLWFIILIRGKLNYGMMKAKNTGALSRHNLRMIALQASQLYRYLDEQISGKCRWSGRTTMTPFIQDIEDDCPEDDGSSIEELPVSVGGLRRRVTSDHDSNSSFIKPKLVKVVGGAPRASPRASLRAPSDDKGAHTKARTDDADGGAIADLEGANPNESTKLTKRTSLLDKMIFWRGPEDQDELFELVMTRRWQQRLKPEDHYVEFGEILDDLPPEPRTEA